MTPLFWLIDGSDLPRRSNIGHVSLVYFFFVFKEKNNPEVGEEREKKREQVPLRLVKYKLNTCVGYKVWKKGLW